jgi:hypothetical protein
LNAPYVIVVADAKDQLFNKDSIKSALTEAVLGDEIIQFRSGGSAHQTFARNGLWHGAAGARNRHVSAVVLHPDTELWKLRNENRQPTLAVTQWRGIRFRLPCERSHASSLITIYGYLAKANS